MAENVEEIVQKIRSKWETSGSGNPDIPKVVTFKDINNSQPIRLTNYDIGGSENFSTDRNGKIIANFSSYLGNTGNEDRLAKDQTWYGDLGRGLTKFLGNTGLNVMNNVSSFTYGIYNGIKEGSLNAVFDNDVSRWFDDQAKRLDTKFATYYTDEEKSQSAIGKLFTFSYLVDGVSNGAAFIAGALIPEVAIAVLTGGASAPASIAKWGAKFGLKSLAKSADNIASSAVKNSAEELAKQTAKNITRDSGMKAIRDMNRWSSVGRLAGEATKTVGFLTRSSMFEAGMEARHSLHDSVDKFMADYETKYGVTPSYEELSQFTQEAGRQANGVFWGNMAILSISNAAMFGKVLDIKPLRAIGLNKVGEVSSKGWDKVIGLSVDTLADGTKVLSKANKLQKIVGYSAPVVSKIASEGVFEEGGQGILGKAMQNYLTGKYVNNDATMTYFDAFSKGVEEQFTTSDGAFEVLMGGVIGLIGGNVSAGIGKTATAMGVQGFEKAQFGVAGMFQDSYGIQRKRLSTLAGKYNKNLEKFRSINRLNSLISHTNENTAEADVFNDTINNYNFLKTSEQFKDVSDTILDYNTAIDNLEFDPVEMRNQGIDSSQIESYKESLKNKFQQDYESYSKSKKIVDRLEFNNTGLSEGNLSELKDALTFSLMSADTAGNKATNIAEQITNLTNGETDVNVIKFFENLDNKNKELAQEYTEKQKEKEALTQKLIEIGASIEGAKDSESRMKQLSKQREGAIKRMTQLDKEIVQVEQSLKERLKTSSFEGMKNSTSTSESVKSVVDSYNALNEYIDVLKRTGKTSEANDIKFLLDQYKKFNTIYLDGQTNISRMMATNFFSKNKPFLSKILGDNYNPTDKFKEILESQELAISGILEDFGYKPENATIELLDLLKNSETLSDREKYQIESVVKTVAMRKSVENILDVADNTINTEQTTNTEGDNTTGDSIRSTIVPENLDNIEQLNNLIQQISSQIDRITNTPTREALQEIKRLRKELAQKEQELLDLQNGKLPVVVEQPQELTTSQQSTPTGKIGNTQYEVKSDGVYYQGKKLDNPSNLPARELVEEHIKGRQQEIPFKGNNEYYNMADYENEKNKLDSIVPNKITLHNGKEATVTLKAREGNWYLVLEDKTGVFGTIPIEHKMLGNKTVREIEDYIAGQISNNMQVNLSENTTLQNRAKYQQLDMTANYIEEKLIINEDSSLRKELEDIRKQQKQIIADNKKIREEQAEKQAALNEKFKNDIIEEINAKYDAEIANIKTNNLENTTEGIQGEDDGREDRLTADIEQLREEIENLETPFKFVESEGYKRYLKLLQDKVNNPENVNEEELAQLESDMDNWFTILGTDVNDDFHLSDLVKQMVALENMDVLDTPNVEEVTEEELEQDIKFSDKVQDNFFAVGINTAVGVSKVVEIEGVNYFEVANISLEGLQQASGVEFSEGMYNMLPDTNSYRLTLEAVEAINNAGRVRIMVPDFDSTSTNYTTIKQAVVNMDGSVEFIPFKTDFIDAVDDNLAYNVKGGESLTISIDRRNDWNDDLFTKLERELGIIPEKEMDERVDREYQKSLANNKKYQEKVNEIRILKNSKDLTTVGKSKLQKLEKEATAISDKIRNDAYDNILKEISKEGGEISEELKKELISKLRIDLIDENGNSVQTIKGTRDNQSNKAESSKAELEALRTAVVNNEDVLKDLAEMGRGATIPLEMKVKIEQVFPGLPNELMVQNESGNVSRVYKPIQQNQMQNIVDTGYIVNGKVVLRNNTDITSDSFIRSSKKRSSATKKPIIVVKKGEQLIAYPIRVASDTIEVDLNEFSAIYGNENTSPTEKAIRLNQIVADAGIDVRVPGNSFIVLGDKLNEETYNNLFARLQNISYLRSVEPLIDSSMSISDALTTVGASTSLNLSDPFSGTKFKMDLSEFKPLETEDSKTGSKVVDAHTAFEESTTNVGIKRIKNDC